MRLRHALPLALLLAAPAASGQVALGVKAGVNVASWQVGGGLALESPRTRFVGGLTARVAGRQLLGAQVDLLYSQKGTESDDGRLRYAADYLEVPLLVRLAFPLSSALDVGLSTGAAVGIPLRGAVEFDGDAETPASEDDLDLQTDLGFVVGLDVGAGPVGVGARYTYGTGNVLANPADPALTPLPTRNEVVSLTVAYRFFRPGR